MADLGGILTRVEARLGPVTSPPVPLDGGITNRNYRVGLGGGAYVVRVSGQDTGLLGIDRAAEHAAARMAAELGIGPAVAAADPDGLVSEFLDAVPLEPGRLRADPRPVARALRAFHDSGLVLPNRFWVPDLLGAYAGIVDARGGTLPGDYPRLRGLAARIAAALPLRDPVPCHNDLLAANLLGTAHGTRIVDWEYAGMGHRLFDLGNLSVNNDFASEDDERLLEAYLGAPPAGPLRAGLRLMRIMSDVREAAWGVVQTVLSTLDFDFAGYARRHLDRCLAAAAAPELDDWLAEAAAVTA